MNSHIISQNEIPLIKNLFDLYKQYYLLSKSFPKKDKYTLGCKCECYVIEVLELSIEASNTMDRNEKKVLLKRINVKFDALKFFIRLAKELNVLDNKKYILLQKQMQDIGKMIGGWQKSLN
jgi:hypothetical protein